MEQEQSETRTDDDAGRPVTFAEIRAAGIRPSDLRDVSWAELKAMTLADLRARLGRRVNRVPPNASRE